MAKRIKIAKTKERKLNIPGFSADASLGPMVSSYRGGTVFSGSASDGRGLYAASLVLGHCRAWIWALTCDARPMAAAISYVGSSAAFHRSRSAAFSTDA